MRILISSMLSLPSHRMGAVRASLFAWHLAAAGHDVVLCTANPLASGFFSDCPRPVSCVAVCSSEQEWESPRDRGEPSVHGPRAVSRLFSRSRLFRGLRTFLADYAVSRNWARASERELIEQDRDPFDVVLSSYGPIGSTILARSLRRRGLVRAWIADFRDLPGGITNGLVARLLLRLHLRSVLRNADAAIVVSQDMKERIGRIRRGQPASNVHVVYNGFDDRMPLAPPIRSDPETLEIAYTGSLYGGRQDLSILFRAIRALQDDGRIQPGRIRIHYAGAEGNVLMIQAENSGLGDAIVDHGIVTRSEARDLQSSCDVLLVATWNTRQETGILTGKFFEYLGIGKPILSIVNGDRPHAEISGLVQRLAVGISCEEAQGGHGRELQAFLERQLDRKRQGGDPSESFDRARVGAFGYSRLSREVEEILLATARKDRSHAS